MTRYKTVFGDDLVEYEEIFDTREEAEEYGCQVSSDYRMGCSELHMSNPGDYEEDDEGIDFDIEAIDE